jgi:hypothetical protein
MTQMFLPGHLAAIQQTLYSTPYETFRYGCHAFVEFLFNLA